MVDAEAVVAVAAASVGEAVVLVVVAEVAAEGVVVVVAEGVMTPAPWLLLRTMTALGNLPWHFGQVLPMINTEHRRHSTATAKL